MVFRAYFYPNKRQFVEQFPTYLAKSQNTQEELWVFYKMLSAFRHSDLSTASDQSQLAYYTFFLKSLEPFQVFDNQPSTNCVF